MESETLNKAIVGRWFANFWGQSYDLAIVDELAAPDMLLQYSMDNPRRGHAAVKSFMTDLRVAFPDLRFERIGPLISDRDIDRLATDVYRDAGAWLHGYGRSIADPLADARSTAGSAPIRPASGRVWRHCHSKPGRCSLRQVGRR